MSTDVKRYTGTVRMAYAKDGPLAGLEFDSSLTEVVLASDHEAAIVELRTEIESFQRLVRNLNTDIAWRSDVAAGLQRDNEMLRSENERLRERLEASEKDAGRYRWLRAHWDEPEVAKLHPWDEFSPDPDQLDAQIDAALKDSP